MREFDPRQDSMRKLTFVVAAALALGIATMATGTLAFGRGGGGGGGAHFGGGGGGYFGGGHFGRGFRGGIAGLLGFGRAFPYYGYGYGYGYDYGDGYGGYYAFTRCGNARVCN
jgi:hypothetical protein